MLSNIDSIWETGYNRIMSEDISRKEQLLWVKEASEGIRGIPSEELVKRQFIYIPNDIYMLHYFGGEIAEYKYGAYRNEQCSFYKRLLFPIRGFNSQVAGLGGWANDSQWKYVYSPDTLWDKSKYFYVHPKDFENALNDNYVVIVDGIFDAINLNRIGIHAVSLMGSNLSNWHEKYLKFFKYIIVIPDNDNAGVFLVNRLLRIRKDTIVVWQGKYKDIDDYIKSSDTSELKNIVNNLELAQIKHKIIIK